MRAFTRWLHLWLGQLLYLRVCFSILTTLLCFVVPMIYSRIFLHRILKQKKDRFSQDNRILKAAATSQIIAVFWYKINFKSMTCFVSMCPLFLICFFPYLSFQKVKQYEFGRWFTLISFVTILCEKVRLYNICLSRILVYYWYGMVPT